MDIKDVSNKKETKCGCVMVKENGRWSIDKHCDTHQPNFQKKADKIMRKRTRKRGRGYTKSLKKKR